MIKILNIRCNTCGESFKAIGFGEIKYYGNNKFAYNMSCNKCDRLSFVITSFKFNLWNKLGLKIKSCLNGLKIRKELPALDSEMTMSADDVKRVYGSRKISTPPVSYYTNLISSMIDQLQNEIIELGVNKHRFTDSDTYIKAYEEVLKILNPIQIEIENRIHAKLSYDLLKHEVSKSCDEIKTPFIQEDNIE